MNQSFNREPGHLAGEELRDLGLVNTELGCRFCLLPASPPDRLLKRLQ
jgi:hypothetical protein